jgi:hypothetical protein
MIGCGFAPRIYSCMNAYIYVCVQIQLMRSISANQVATHQLTKCIVVFVCQEIVVKFHQNQPLSLAVVDAPLSDLWEFRCSTRIAHIQPVKLNYERHHIIQTTTFTTTTFAMGFTCCDVRRVTNVEFQLYIMHLYMYIIESAREQCANDTKN